MRSFHVANIDAATVIMTEESPIYTGTPKGFAGHHTVNHSANEYVRLGSYIHINTAKSFFSVVKRGITGTYHSVNEAHLHRCRADFDFRYNDWSKHGCEDAERAERALVGVVRKRLTYRGADRSA